MGDILTFEAFDLNGHDTEGTILWGDWMLSLSHGTRPDGMPVALMESMCAFATDDGWGLVGFGQETRREDEHTYTLQDLTRMLSKPYLDIPHEVAEGCVPVFVSRRGHTQASMRTELPKEMGLSPNTRALVDIIRAAYRASSTGEVAPSRKEHVPRHMARGR